MDFQPAPGDVHERIRKLFDEAKKMPPLSASRSPAVYGFTMCFTNDGRPQVSEFGNVSPYGVSGYMEPITDVVEKYDSVSIVLELPGVRKEDIDLRTSADCVFIKVDTAFRKYLKDVRLSCKIRPESAQARYNNGVLEVSLKRADDAPQGHKIKIK
jgi:HSP20 family protein